jgi:hypothetical protein
MALLHQFHGGIFACPDNESGLKFFTPKHQWFILHHSLTLLSTTDCLHNFDTVPGTQGCRNMCTAWDHFHVDSNRRTVAIGDA